MDYDPFWNKDDLGLYCIVFPNKNALSNEEIKEIFSAFGNVLSVTCAGDAKGHRFVRYASLEEVIKAIEGVKGHQKVKLIYHKSKTNNQGQKNINDGANKGREKDTNTRSNRRTTSPSSDGDRKMNNQQQKQNFRKKNFKTEEEISLQDSSFDDTASISSQSSGKASISQRYQNILRKSNSSGQKIVKETVNRSVSESMPALGATPKRTISKTLESKLEKMNINEDEIPDLVRTRTKKIDKSEPKIKIVNAECVTVGNIHPEFGPAYILHLLDLYDPIAITYVQLVPNTNIRYCHVYFKTISEVVKVEKAFDGQDLNGQKLVVISQTRLLEGAIL